MAWEDFQQIGIFRTKTEFLNPQSIAAYKWMTAQMAVRIGSMPDGVLYPVWAWYQYDAINKQHPDLYRLGHLSSNEKGVLLEFDCPVSSVLLSDFLAWQRVLANTFLATNEADYLTFNVYSSTLSADEYARKKNQSWDLIFDLNLSDPAGYITSPQIEERLIQGALWELRLEQVQSATLFAS
jgi:hypothetical protein